MSSTDRQNRLLVAEDWKKIYTTFRNADFTSYSFETVRRVLIDYIRENYSESFDDYINSSEFLSLIDMIAFLSQSIAFRVDLNARDNFLELAERRDSVLRLSRLVGYNSKRNIPAQGLLKFATVSTTQNVIDSNGRNLSEQVIAWNDSANPNWYDQFIKVMNAAMSPNQQFGNPSDKATIYGIPTEHYRFEANNTDVPIYSFTKTVAGRAMNFEVTSTTFKNQNFIYEEAPKVGNKLACVYKDDGRGPASTNSGFFLNIVQGVLNAGSFNIAQPSTNETVDIETQNINNNDVWLYRLDQTGNEAEAWEKVPAFEGNNIIYNSLNKNIRNIYEVVTRTNDTISLLFSDGTFGNLPLGEFRVYYRTSNGLNYTINPQDMRSVLISVPYLSRQNQPETLSISLNLVTSISNSTEAESNDRIKAVAPATYYTQNRMITGEDYNISPLSVNQQILKIKSINRTSSGISRYFDLIDPTGKYSSTNLFATDGIIYQEDYSYSTRFSYTTRTDIEGIIYNDIFKILDKSEIKNFYYSRYANSISSLEQNAWITVTSDPGMSTGYIRGQNNEISRLGDYSSSITNFKYYKSGALVKFVAPIINNVQYYFDLDNNNQLVSGNGILPVNYTDYIWAEVISVVDDGTASNTGILPTGLGPVTMNKILPQGITYGGTEYNISVSQIIPKWTTTVSASVIANMINLIQDNKPFGLRYDITSTSWQIVYESDLNISAPFSRASNGTSWILLFTTDNEFYTVTSRESRFVFESDHELGFYYDKSNTVYDSTTSTIIKDSISILSVNTQPNSREPLTQRVDWNIISEFNGLDGFVDGKKIVLGYSNQDNNDTADDPDAFTNLINSSIVSAKDFEIGKVYKIVSLGNTTWNTIAGTDNRTYSPGDIFVAATNSNTTGTAINFSYIIEQRYYISQGQEDYKYVDNNDGSQHGLVKFLTTEFNPASGDYAPGQYFYFIDKNVVKRLNDTKTSLIPSLDYKVYVGRSNLKFQYTHSADYVSRIDPGASNIIDIFVLTKSYDTAFRQWLSGSGVKPLPPSSNELYDVMAPTLYLLKATSDEIVFHPVAYTVLFGPTADTGLQATFKVTKNTNQVVSDNEIKSRVIDAINQFFLLENWDFGDTFYFTEMAAYVIKQLAPDITNFVIVPKQSGLNFGSLFEIKSSSDRLFINGATVNDIEIITGITPSNIKSINGATNTSSLVSEQTITSSLYGSF